MSVDDNSHGERRGGPVHYRQPLCALPYRLPMEFAAIVFYVFSQPAKAPERTFRHETL